MGSKGKSLKKNRQNKKTQAHVPKNFSQQKYSKKTPAHKSLPISTNPINWTFLFLREIGRLPYLLLSSIVILFSLIVPSTFKFFSFVGKTIITTTRNFLTQFSTSFSSLGKQSLNLIQLLDQLITSSLSFFYKKKSSRKSIKGFSPPRLPELPSISLKLPRFRLPRLALSHKLFFTPLTLVFFAIALLSSTFYFYIVKDLPNPTQLSSYEPELTTQIFDRNGELLFKIYNHENRTLVPLSEIPDSVRYATIAIEDKTFYQHSGFSIRGIARAFSRNLTSSDLEGGSTITQQLIKNTLLSRERTITRKLKEVLLSINTELLFDKNQILEMYFNTVAYGGPAYGIQEASQQYFNKNVQDLTLAEAVLLAGLPKAPTKYSPFGARSELAKNRQLQVLYRMLEDGYITTEQASAAAAEPLDYASPNIGIKAPHFVMYVRDLLVDQYGEELVQKGGLQVHTTLDLRLQDQAQTILNSELESIGRLNVRNGAVLITKPKTGEILAMVGSRDYFDTDNDGQVNLTTALRQPGSSIKPVNYALAFEKGLTPATVVNDSPITFNMVGSPPWSPKNYDGRFHGQVTLRTALASSYNIPAVLLLARNGVDQMVDLGQRLGITTWTDPSRFGLALTLGSNEVKMVDMAEVYGTFANLGTHVNLNPITSITDGSGRTLSFNPCHPTPTPEPAFPNQVQATSDCSPTQVLNPQTAYLLNDILSDPIARSPAFGTRSVLNIPDNQVAVKTGTSNDLRDNWTIGYTSDFLVASWVGNNDNTPMSAVASGITGASPIWAKTISLILNDSPHAAFPVPNNLVQVPICTLTGTLTCGECPSTRLETFAKGTEPTVACTAEQLQAISEASTTPAPIARTGTILPEAISTSR